MKADSARVARTATSAGPAASAIVLAGGRSSRLGQDKAAVFVGGRRLLDRVLSLLVGLCEDLVVVGRAGWPGAPALVRFVEDDLPGLGPLSGLYAGLGVIKHQRTLAVGCDMPFISPELLQRLIAEDGAAATVVRTGAQVQPLLAVYDRRVRPVIRELLASGERSLLALLGAIDVRYVDVGAEERSAFSINRPEDLRRAEELLRLGGEG